MPKPTDVTGEDKHISISIATGVFETRCIDMNVAERLGVAWRTGNTFASGFGMAFTQVAGKAGAGTVGNRRGEAEGFGGVGKRTRVGMKVSMLKTRNG